jgi:hypothetical protein
MKNHFVIIILLAVIFHHCCSQAQINKVSALPSNSLINDVIYSVIQLDSLQRAFRIGKHIFIPRYYQMPEWDKNSPFPPPPPQPPSRYGSSFDEVFGYFNSEDDPNLRIKDSIFIIQQTDTTRSHRINRCVSNLFSRNSNDVYYFSLPIFSFDKNTVVVEYSNEFYRGYLTVLKKVDDKWVIVEHKTTWMR